MLMIRIIGLIAFNLFVCDSYHIMSSHFDFCFDPSIPLSHSNVADLHQSFADLRRIAKGLMDAVTHYTHYFDPWSLVKAMMTYIQGFSETHTLIPLCYACSTHMFLHDVAPHS